MKPRGQQVISDYVALTLSAPPPPPPVPGLARRIRRALKHCAKGQHTPHPFPIELPDLSAWPRGTTFMSYHNREHCAVCGVEITVKRMFGT